MPIDWDTELDEMVNDLKMTGDGLYTRVAEERRPILERCIRRMGELTAMKLTDPANQATHEQDFQHNWNTLISEAAGAQALAEQAFWDFVGRVINRITTIALRLIP